MKFLSTDDDLGLSLKALPSSLARVVYLECLRDPDGIFRHWGLARVHGQDSSSSAIRAAQIHGIEEMLRNPAWRITKDLNLIQLIDGPYRMDIAELSSSLRSNLIPRLPEHQRGHLDATLDFLECIANSNARTDDLEKEGTQPKVPTAED